jgi:hypothetical protein
MLKKERNLLPSVLPMHPGTAAESLRRMMGLLKGDDKRRRHL